MSDRPTANSQPSAANPESLASRAAASEIRGQHLLFVTGRLAEASLREVLESLSAALEFTYEVQVPGIQVAALLHSSLLLRRLHVGENVDRVILPGWCQGDLRSLEEHFGRPFECGPKDLRDLPQYFGLGRRKHVDLSGYSIEIIAEINHATRMSISDVVAEAKAMAAAGADVIDVGCVPGESCSQVGAIVSALRDQNLRVSIDSFDRHEVEQAVECGAELILSCNHSNIDWVTSLNTEVVAIPDTPDDLESLDRLIERLSATGAAFRVDPIIEPIGMGFTASLQRYMTVRQRHPSVQMMMGIGNVTELTEVDSAGVNMVLAAICEELGIQSVLTTQVINWCRTAVAEFNAARRLVHHAVANHTIPKHLDSSLLMLREARLDSASDDSLKQLAAALTDANYRIFSQPGGLHLMNRDGHWSGEDAFKLFGQAIGCRADSMDPGHAFYLGYELARAEIARHLGKRYIQDEPMSWGLIGDLRGSASVHPAGPAEGEGPS
jgi:dihydropteroate synthase